MRKSLGLLVLIGGLCGLATLWQMNHGAGGSSFMTSGNWKNLLTWVGLFGVLSLAQAVVIDPADVTLQLSNGTPGPGPIVTPIVIAPTNDTIYTAATSIAVINAQQATGVILDRPIVRRRIRRRGALSVVSQRHVAAGERTIEARLAADDVGHADLQFESEQPVEGRRSLVGCPSHVGVDQNDASPGTGERDTEVRDRRRTALARRRARDRDQMADLALRVLLDGDQPGGFLARLHPPPGHDPDVLAAEPGARLGERVADFLGVEVRHLLRGGRRDGQRDHQRRYSHRHGRA